MAILCLSASNQYSVLYLGQCIECIGLDNFSSITEIPVMNHYTDFSGIQISLLHAWVFIQCRVCVLIAVLLLRYSCVKNTVNVYLLTCICHVDSLLDFRSHRVGGGGEGGWGRRLVKRPGLLNRIPVAFEKGVGRGVQY